MHGRVVGRGVGSAVRLEVEWRGLAEEVQHRPMHRQVFCECVLAVQVDAREVADVAPIAKPHLRASTRNLRPETRWFDPIDSVSEGVGAADAKEPANRSCLMQGGALGRGIRDAVRLDVEWRSLAEEVQQPHRAIPSRSAARRLAL